VDEPRSSGLLRANVSVALGTAASRVTGVLRWVALAYALGQASLSDAYNLANNAPNAVYELILGGVLSATLVPVFTAHLEDRDDEATNAVVSVAAIALALLTVVAVLCAPLIVRLLTLSPAEGVDAGELRDVGTELARFLLPQIFFYGLMALGSALLNARRRFFAPAWAPVLNNLVVIAVFLVVGWKLAGEPGLNDAERLDWLVPALGLGSTLGIAVMTIALVPALVRAGVKLRFRPDWRHPAVRHILALSVWTVGYVVANQVALVVVQNLTSPGDGDLTAYQLAFVFFQFPHGLLAVSITTTFTPDLARAWHRRDLTAFNDRMSLGLRMLGLLVIPASVGYLVLAKPLVVALLQRGAFDAADATATADALAAFALGLFGFSAYLFVLRGFYAQQNTQIPFWVNLVENALNIVLAVALVGAFGVPGLAAAFAVAYLVSAVVAAVVLDRRIPGLDLPAIGTSLLRLAAAAAAMGVVVWLVTSRVGGTATVSEAAVRTAVGVGVGVGAYVGFLALFRVPELASVRGLLRRPRPVAPVDP
jgi:putative peptidoglycan lipid II flippase